MIKTVELTKIFRTDEVETTALNKVNLEISHGEFVAIMGPSGCGKSTLLNILGLLDNPTDGKLLFLDNDVTKFSERNRTNLRKSNIGFVFQSFNLIDELNVFENVELPLLYQKVSAGERKRKVEEVLDRMKISHRKKHFPQQLSGGQQQRVALARAIARKPKLLLLDEPLSALDSDMRIKLQKEILAINSVIKTTIIFVSHDIPEVFKLADEVLVVENGQFTKRGTPSDIFVNEKTDLMGELISVKEEDGKKSIRILVDGKIVGVDLPN